MRGSVLGTVAATVGLMAVGLTPGVAAAETTPSTDGRAALAASAPTISPAADFFYYPGPGYTCPEGNLCLRVWDPTRSTYKVFKLYNCATYSLSNWNGVGGYANRQTGSRATATFYGQNGGVLKNVPVGESIQGYDWTPVWKVRNCY